MKLVGGLILWAFIAVDLLPVGRREEREGWDALALRDVERREDPIGA